MFMNDHTSVEKMLPLAVVVGKMFIWDIHAHVYGGNDCLSHNYFKNNTTKSATVMHKEISVNGFSELLWSVGSWVTLSWIIAIAKYTLCEDILKPWHLELTLQTSLWSVNHLGIFLIEVFVCLF